MTPRRTAGCLFAVAALGAALACPGVPAATATSAASAAAPVHQVSVTGTGVGTYPGFDPAIARYGVTTTSATGGTLTVTATTSDPSGMVTVNGSPAPGGTRTLTGLTAGDEVAVFITDSGGTARHSWVYLPPQFPALERVTLAPAPGALAPGLVLLTLGLYVQPSPFFETAVDLNGVPAFVRQRAQAMDLQVQPNGRYSVFVPVTVAGRTGSDLLELDSQWREVARHRTVGLVNTDGHDAIVLPDGTRWLMAYEDDPVTSRTDAVIQRIDPDGSVGFTWSSAPYAAETVTPGNPDYAHINSMQLLPDGDLLASFRHFSSVFRIATHPHDGFLPGEVVWKLGGRDSDFTFPSPEDTTGPCAQHTAAMLPNGNILMYDNGSWNNFGAETPLCVDQADPTGPTIQRLQTRVVEYQLDTSAHTATEVRTYAPPARFDLRGLRAAAGQRQHRDRLGGIDGGPGQRDRPRRDAPLGAARPGQPEVVQLPRPQGRRPRRDPARGGRHRPSGRGDVRRGRPRRAVLRLHRPRRLQPAVVLRDDGRHERPGRPHRDGHRGRRSGKRHHRHPGLPRARRLPPGRDGPAARVGPHRRQRLCARGARGAQPGATVLEARGAGAERRGSSGHPHLVGERRTAVRPPGPAHGDHTGPAARRVVDLPAEGSRPATFRPGRRPGAGAGRLDVDGPGRRPGLAAQEELT